MNLTLIVSVGVPAKIASQIRAPNLQINLSIGARLPFLSIFIFLNYFKVPNLTPDLGIEPRTNTDSQKYIPKGPLSLIVYFAQSMIPLYFPTFSSNYNCVLMYSVEYVIHVQCHLLYHQLLSLLQIGYHFY